MNKNIVIIGDSTIRKIYDFFQNSYEKYFRLPALRGGKWVLLMDQLKCKINLLKVQLFTNDWLSVNHKA